MRSTALLAALAAVPLALSGCGAVDEVTADDAYSSESDPCPAMRPAASRLLGAGFADGPRRHEGDDCAWKAGSGPWYALSVRLVVFRREGMSSGESRARIHHEKGGLHSGAARTCPGVSADCLYSVDVELDWLIVSVRDRNRTVTATLRAAPENGLEQRTAVTEATVLGRALAAVP